MSTPCPNGHPSETSDYCDQCGARMDAPAGVRQVAVDPSAGVSPVPDASQVEVPYDTAPCQPSEPCPACHTPRADSDKFCESCGYNFATGQSARSQPPIRSADLAERWELVVEADRAYFEQITASDVDFPAHYQARSFVLEQPELAIGRHNPNRGVRPQIDLSGAPEDPAVSHLHAILLREDDGSYVLLDPGSSNGTTLNDDPTPVATNARVPLRVGDRIHLGAWTTLTIRRRGV